MRALLVRNQARWLVGLVIVGVVAVALARHWEAGKAEQRAVATIPETERGALYEELLQSTEMLCARARVDDGLFDRCADSANFLLTFPECDDACRNLARIHHRGATR